MCEDLIKRADIGTRVKVRDDTSLIQVPGLTAEDDYNRWINSEGTLLPGKEDESDPYLLHVMFFVASRRVDSLTGDYLDPLKVGERRYKISSTRIYGCDVEEIYE